MSNNYARRLEECRHATRRTREEATITFMGVAVVIGITTILSLLGYAWKAVFS